MSFTRYSAFLLNDGTVKTIGYNAYGQCGTGNTNTPQLSLYTIPNLNNVKQIACGFYHTAFLLNDGTIRLIGNNDQSQCGTGNTNTPQLYLYDPGLINVKQVACGNSHTLFLLNNGTVKTVGRNQCGQCGTGDTNTPQLSLYTIPGLNNVKQVIAGYDNSLFLLNDGTVKAVGNNQYGQLGTGTTTSPQLSLFTIPNLNNVKEISYGLYHTVFLLNDGTVRTIGNNEYGQCGTGNTNTPQLYLYTIPNLNNVKQVTCGQYHTVFLLNDGTVRTVGYNQYGQCGTGNTTTPQLTLYKPGLTNVKQITCGYNHTVFLLEDGTIKTIGYNDSGQCGTGNTTSPQLTLYTIPNLNTTKSLWNIYIEQIIKYLIKQGSNYYSLKSSYYDSVANQYIPLTLPNNTINSEAITSYGFDTIDELTNLVTINDQTFKPIDKLLSIFTIQQYVRK